VPQLTDVAEHYIFEMYMPVGWRAKNRSMSLDNARTSLKDFSASHPLLVEEGTEEKHLQHMERFCRSPS